MSFSRQSMLGALALVLVVSLPIVSAQATSIHQTGNFVAGTLVGEFNTAPTSPGNFGSGAEVTWSLMPTNLNSGGPAFNFFHADGGGILNLSEFMEGQWKAEIERAFAAWSDVANITFTEVDDDGAALNAATTGGDIRIGGAVFDGPGNLIGHAHFPDCSACVSLGSDIHFDIAEDWTIGHAGPGFDIFTVAAHEIGHAIGLDHSEQNDALMFGVYSEAFVGLQADDILGAQSIYGVAPPTFAIVVLPEPDTVVLLTTGLIGLGACRRNLRVRT